MDDLKRLVAELEEIQFFKAGALCVIGCSTSEVIGEKIGTHSSDEVAAQLMQVFRDVHVRTGVDFCFQGCEHINRALTMERSVMERYGLEEVSVVPVSGAGGSMSQAAYKHFKAPVVVEHVQADCGIDIGQTLIGMHIKHVQIPVRTSVKQIGGAVVTIATHRSKLIGGARAQYK